MRSLSVLTGAFRSGKHALATRRVGVTVVCASRYDLIGHVDCVLFCREWGGRILTAAIAPPYVRATLSLRHDHGIRVTEHGQLIWTGTLRSLSGYHGSSLAVTAIKLMAAHIDCGFDLDIESTVPRGSGLASSSSVAVAVIASVRLAFGADLSGPQIAWRAMSAEAKALDVAYGQQDQFNPVTGGGIKLLEWAAREHVPSVKHLPWDVCEEVQRRVLLYEIDEGRAAKQILDAIKERVRCRDPRVISALKDMNRLAEDMWKSLVARKLDEVPAQLNCVWQRQRSLDPTVSSDTIEHMMRIARGAGSAAEKMAGAGGRGTLIVWCDPAARDRVGRALAEAGASRVDFSIARRGLAVDHVPERGGRRLLAGAR